MKQISLEEAKKLGMRASEYYNQPHSIGLCPKCNIEVMESEFGRTLMDANEGSCVQCKNTYIVYSRDPEQLMRKK